MRGIALNDALIIAAILTIAMLLRMINPAWFSPRKSLHGRKRIPVGDAVLVVGCLIVMTASLAVTNGRKLPDSWAEAAAAEPDSRPWLKPDSIVRFRLSEVACGDAHDLEQTIVLGLSGKGTKMNAYFTGQDGAGPRCTMLEPQHEYKVIDVTPDDRERPDVLLADIVGKDVKAAEHGTYVLIPDRSRIEVVR
jgi:hypothetical protein